MCHSRTSCWGRDDPLKSGSWQAGKRRWLALCHFLFPSEPATQPCFGTAGSAQRMTRRAQICESVPLQLSIVVANSQFELTGEDTQTLKKLSTRRSYAP